jgi:MarR family transcriptional regulator, lower aerobic nicotinate degradation pathway regulator
LVTERLAAAGSRRYHYSLLAALDELGPASQAEFSRRTAIDRSDMVTIINELTEQGYVERSADTSDGRRNVVTITPAGRRQLRKLDRLVARAQDELLTPLSPEQRHQLIGLLTSLVEYHATP